MKYLLLPFLGLIITVAAAQSKRLDAKSETVFWFRLKQKDASRGNKLSPEFLDAYRTSFRQALLPFSEKYS